MRPDGTVKVLDFGIAKFAAAAPPAGPPRTAHGAVAGTPAWMSPEQAKGLPVDKRADIWAFGLLLFQILTGSNPFERTTFADTAAAVLNTEPGWDALPPQFRRLIRKCLEKDPRRRLRDIGDAWDLIEPAAQPPASHRPRPRMFVRLAIPALVASIGILVWRGLAPEGGQDQRLMRLDLDLGPEMPLDASGAANLVLSPDGSAVAFVSRGRLFLRRLQDAAPTQIPGVQGAYTPFFSPDGKWIAFFAQGKLQKVAIEGGAAFDICPSNAYFAGGAWGPDGTIVAALAPSGPLQIVPASGGTPQPLSELDRTRRESTHRLPQFLPGGKAILFTSHTAITGFDDAEINVITLPDRRRKHLIRGGTFGRYVPSGHLLYVSHGVLYAAPFDTTRLEIRGEPVKAAGDIAHSLLGSAQLDAAAGTLVYRTGASGIANVILERLEAGGRRQPVLTKPGTYLNPRVSPDGRRILLTVRQETELALSAYEVRRDALQPVVRYGAVPPSPWTPVAVWTPDGKFAVFRASLASGEGGMYWIRMDGSGVPQRLTASSLSQSPASFSPDGRTLAFYQGVGLLGATDIWTVAITNDGSALRAGEAKPLVETKAEDGHPAFSRDGRWIAYASAGEAGLETFVKPWPDDGRSWQISSAGGSEPMFSRTRDELFFLNPDRQLMAVPYRTAKGDFVAGRPRLWSERRLADLGAMFWSYDPLPGDDGVLALTATGSPERERSRLTVLLNFFDHLRRIAPAR